MFSLEHKRGKNKRFLPDFLVESGVSENESFEIKIACPTAPHKTLEEKKEIKETKKGEKGEQIT